MSGHAAVQGETQVDQRKVVASFCVAIVIALRCQVCVVLWVQGSVLGLEAFEEGLAGSRTGFCSDKRPGNCLINIRGKKEILEFNSD